MAKDAADICRELGGSVITLWFENDGFDYSFQMDYEDSWSKLVEGIREVADYAPDMKISIEYKPYEERDFAMVDSAGMTLYLIHDVNRDNVGCTLDFCHMLMKHDNPSFGLALAASKGKLFGLHMNDGYGWKDSGLIFGSVNFTQAAEFIYYLERYKYDGVVFFDTFPIREESKAECQANIDAFELIKSKVDKIGVDKINEVVSKHDGISAQKLILDMLR
jgi:xylose isomerase